MNPGVMEFGSAADRKARDYAARVMHQAQWVVGQLQGRLDMDEAALDRRGLHQQQHMVRHKDLGPKDHCMAIAVAQLWETARRTAHLIQALS